MGKEGEGLTLVGNERMRGDNDHNTLHTFIQLSTKFINNFFKKSNMIDRKGKEKQNEKVKWGQSDGSTVTYCSSRGPKLDS